MEKSEIIRRLEKIATHAIHFTGETPFMMGLDDGIAVKDAAELLKEQEAEARLLTADEVKNMEAGTAFGIETYYDHDGERIPGCAWALRTESLILSFFGTMFPDTVTKIPYNTLEKNQNTGKHEKHQYRFWSKKPTFEQCKAVKWE